MAIYDDRFRTLNTIPEARITVFERKQGRGGPNAEVRLSVNGIVPLYVFFDDKGICSNPGYVLRFFEGLIK